MPIRPENKARYPKNWSEISARIRFDRAGGRCECTGECGLDHEKEYENFEPEFLYDPRTDAKLGSPQRCIAIHHALHPITQAKVILTTAHLPGKEIEECGDDDIKGMCQRCHNRMDARMRQAGIRIRAHACRAVRDMFEEGQNA
ncbi:MAG TPA: hypothetical protein VHB73_00960 [Alphaproteobacteria bacterium]|nr:hypothetical protein [Alphaproteobacteria bacterium]